METDRKIIAFENTFDQSAINYDRVRPMYAAEIFEDIFRYKALGFGSQVMEIGIGTGKATQPFLEKNCTVCALEPGGNLAAIAREKYHEYENFLLHEQTLQEFEEKAEFDLIYSATAFHWIPEEYGYPRVYELLRTGGAFARFAYHAGPDRGRPELTEEIQQLYKNCMDRGESPKLFDLQDAAQLAGIAEKYGFTDIEYHLYETTKDFTAQEYMQLLTTYPDHMKLEENARRKLFAGIYDAIERHGGVITVYYVMDVELARKG